MTKTAARRLGALTILPVILIWVAAAVIYGTVNLPHKIPPYFNALFNAVLLLEIFSMLGFCALLFFYISHALQNSSLPRNRKILWIAFLLFGNFIVMPIYWYLHVWKPIGSPSA